MRDESNEGERCEKCNCIYSCGCWPSKCPYCENSKLQAEIERLEKKVELEQRNVKYRDDIIGLSPDGDRHADLVSEIERLTRQLTEAEEVIEKQEQEMYLLDMAGHSLRRDHLKLIEQLKAAEAGGDDE